MPIITFVTGNDHKLRAARHVLQQFDIGVTQQALAIPEIQSEDGAEIVRDKAAKAYELLQKPLVVNDDTWNIPGLRGFPGPYMKDINQWFTAEDFLRLTLPLEDRRVFLCQYTVYQDEYGQHLFVAKIEGALLPAIHGAGGNPNDQIISFHDQGLSNAEVHAQGKSSIAHRHTVWHELGEWLQEHNATA